jgi:ubiquinone/menaquinone biosynthesis C-methylase UbiE
MPNVVPLAALRSRVRLGTLIVTLVPPLLIRAQSPASEPPLPRYESRQSHNPDGIGKFYQGREIAQVMGHQAADWLDRPEREEEERPTLLLRALKIRPGDTIADIGAGSGYLTLPIAQLTGARGRVYGVDIQQEMLDLLSHKATDQHLTNIVPVLGTVTNVNLSPSSIDLALLVDVYHEFSEPFEMMRSICQALKPSGRVIFVEYRGEDPDVPIKPLHKMTEQQVRKEMAIQPLQWIETIRGLPRQHIIVFKKRQ